MASIVLRDINTIKNVLLVNKERWHWRNLKWKAVRFVQQVNIVLKELLLERLVILDIIVFKEHLIQNFIQLLLELKF